MNIDEHQQHVHGEHGHPSHSHRVTVSIDGRNVQLIPKDYTVSQLKQVLGVPSDYALDQVKHGQLVPLEDHETVKVHEHDTFISHVRCGTSS